MKKVILISAFVVLTIVKVFAGNEYKFTLDLGQVTNDKISVVLNNPDINETNVTYRLPAMVPGTYSVYNFGRFIENFKAFDKQGNELLVAHPDSDSWTIQNATLLNKVTYDVNDTWDAGKNNFVFEPGGTNIDAGKNFMINQHGFFGYFDNYKKNAYTIEFKRPVELVGSTALIPVSVSNESEVYHVNNYMELTDSPIMFCKPDTTILSIGGAEILVSLYDEGHKVKSSDIASNVKAILTAAKDYLGGSLPIKKYAFLVYLFDRESGSGASGALEHSYSSMYFLPSLEGEQIAQVIRDVAAHEFYHIITPLTIHSEEIGDFDYANPKMSKHLWLYEGVTEYTAGYVQLRQGLLSIEQYLETMAEKITVSKSSFNDTLPFTVMSKNCLDKYKEQYENVYLKGALIGLCLDVKLRELSNGSYGLQDLIDRLGKEYGKERSFKDDELFNKITSLTYPEIRGFFSDYVEGNKPLPLKETLAAIGFNYEDSKVQKGFSLGGIAMAVDKQTGMISVYDTEKMNEFGKALGYKPGDVFIKFNKKKISAANAGKLINEWRDDVKEGDKLKVQVLRDENGKQKKHKLTAKVYKMDITEPLSISPMANPSAQQTTLLNKWLGKS